MKKRVGIWIGYKKSNNSFSGGDGHKVNHIYSYIESRERIPGETSWFTGFGFQFLNIEKRKKNRRANEIREYLKKVVNEINPAGQAGLLMN